MTVFTGLPEALQPDEQAWLGHKGVRFLAEPVVGLTAHGDRLFEAHAARRGEARGGAAGRRKAVRAPGPSRRL